MGTEAAAAGKKKRTGLRPGLRVGLPAPEQQGSYREVFRFRRSWPAIIILLVLDIVFLIPAVTTAGKSIEMWQQPEDLFDLVGALFTTFWLMGWSLAPLLMTAILLVLLFGREVVSASRDGVEVFLGLPFIGLAARYQVSHMRNLRLEHPAPKSGTSWRGSHLVFDYGANTGEIGSSLNELDLAAIRGRIEAATGENIRVGEALPEELANPWDQDAAERSVSAVTQDERDTTLGSATTLALIVANLIPLLGALFWQWDLGALMVLYWAESAIIGFFNLCKILVIGRWSGIFLGIFFLGHFGGFMAGHFLFIYTLFVEGLGEGSSSGGDLRAVAEMFTSLWPALLVLFLSHGYSFFANFLGRREYLQRTVKTQMSEPYGRIVLMHLVIIFGGALSMALGEATPALVLLIAAKTLVDVRAHRKEHR